MKKIMSVILVACMLFALIPAAYAQDNTPVADEAREMATLREVYELRRYADRFKYLFYIEGYTNPLDSLYLLRVNDDIEKGEDFKPILSEVDDLRFALKDEESDITKSQLKEYYEKLDSTAKDYTVNKIELRILFDRCGDEQNINSYYSDDIWLEFCEALDEAEEVYLDSEITDKSVSDAYWSLRYAYDNLCAVNTTAGDVDFNGVADIVDATLIQRYCTKVIQLNSSQKIVATFDSVYSKDDIDITDATILQRYCTKVTDSINSSWLPVFINYDWRGKTANNNGYFTGYRNLWIIEHIGEWVNID